MSGCDGYPDADPGDELYEGLWYYYPAEGWWNQWWYNAPYDPCRRKIVWVNFLYAPFDPSQPGLLEVTINWSLPEWSQNPFMPPLPDLNGELYLQRLEPVWTLEILPYSEPQLFFSDEFQLPIDYNPEWVSIDVRGVNFIIFGPPEPCGEFYHECIPWDDDLADPIAVITGDYLNILGRNIVRGGAVNLDGSLSTDDCVIVSYDWELKSRDDPANDKSATGKTPNITGVAKGTYDVTLTVTDNVGKTGQDTIEMESCFISTAILGSH
ncbi:PKD domain-containing protein [Candidatus Dojkabacteria bacterium]|nr:PKD domain-containing protein [Candidatus Dojkabacteria bacterium]